jgi:DNA-binding NarL/FixJ family response regulator
VVVRNAGKEPIRAGSMQPKSSGVPTYVIASNRLAGEYLIQILAKDRFTRPILCERLPQPRLRSTLTVFVVDGSFIPLPVSECIRRLGSLFPKGRFVMVDKPHPYEEVLHLMKLGFHAFVEHSKVAGSLVSAVRAVAARRTWISTESAERYVYLTAGAGKYSDSIQPPKSPKLPTPRETEVLELVKQRLSNKEIATILDLSEKTVKFHLSNILAKFGAESRRELETSKLGSAPIWEELSKVRTS